MKLSSEKTTAEKDIKEIKFSSHNFERFNQNYIEKKIYFRNL